MRHSRLRLGVKSCYATSIKTRIETETPTLTDYWKLVVMLLPLKQGLKQQGTGQFGGQNLGCYATSIKTRIETGHSFRRNVCGVVVMLLPLKQGLKLKLVHSLHCSLIVVMLLPLKQGLKR